MVITNYPILFSFDVHLCFTIPSKGVVNHMASWHDCQHNGVRVPKIETVIIKFNLKLTVRICCKTFRVPEMCMLALCVILLSYDL